jgi:iron(III) transport system permease protein
LASKIPLIVFLLVSILFIVPLAIMVYGSFIPSFAASDRLSFTTQFVVRALTAPDTGPLLWNTIVFGAGGSALAIALGGAFAWFMERTDMPGKKFLSFLPILSLTLPLAVKGFAWIFLFHPRIGLVNISLERLFNLPGPPFNIYSIWGMIFAWGTGGIPLAYLMIQTALKSMDPTLEEASRAAGNGIITTLRKVTLPVIAPAILSAYLLLTIMGTENFDYPFLLGAPGGINTLATKMYNLAETRLQISSASAYGIMYILITFVLMGIYVWSVRKSFRFVVVTGKAARLSFFKLGGWKWPAAAFCIIVLVLSFGLQMGMVVLVSLVPYYTVGGGYNPFSVLTLDNYAKALQIPQFWLSVSNSFELSFAAAIIATLLGSVMTYAMVKGKTRGKRVLEFMSTLPLAFPGILYAIGLIWTAFLIPGLVFIYGTTWIMLLALVVVWLPFSIRYISSSLVQISDELEEASAVSGSRWSRTYLRITVPLLKDGMVNSFIYVFVNSFRELGAVVILSNASTIVMIVLLLNLFEQQAGAYPVVAAMSVMMVLMLTAAMIVTRIVTRTSVRS